MSNIRKLEAGQDIRGDDFMDYVYSRLSFTLPFEIFKVIDEVFARVWHHTKPDELFIEEHLVMEVKETLVKEKIILDEDKVRIVVRLMFNAMYRYGLLGKNRPEAAFDISDLIQKKELLKKAIQRFRANEKLSDRSFKTWEELDQEMKKCRIDPYEILVKLDIMVDPYTLYILKEWILPERMEIEIGLMEMIRAEGHAFDIEMLLWKNTDKKTIMKYLFPKLNYLPDYLEYIHRYSLFIENQDKEE